MALSYARSVASGSTDTFSVPFPYLEKEHVTVSIDGVVLSPSAYTWPTDGSIKITAGNPVAGAIVERRRVTASDPLVAFAPGNLEADDLNTGDRQSLYVAQEAADAGGDLAGRAWVTDNFTSGGTIKRGVEGDLVFFDADGNIVPGTDVGIETLGTAAGADVGDFATAAQGAKVDQLPNTVENVKALSTTPSGGYKLTIPGMVSAEQFKTPSNTWADALTAAKAHMAALGAAADGPLTGMFIVPAGIDVGNADYDFQDTRVWFMPGSKVYGNNHPRIEHHVRNLQDGYQNHQDHTFPILRFYDAVRPDDGNPALSNGWLKGGAGLSVYAAMGQYSPAIGTPFSLFLAHEVFDTAAPDIGRNEPAGIYNYLAARNGKTQSVTNFWSQDNHLITPKIAPGWAGLSAKLGNMAPQPAIDATYAGVVGWSIVHRIPQASEISFAEPSRVGDSSYTAFAGIAINGYAGQITADDHINSGTHASATEAFYYGLKIGGPGGTPYMDHLARSKFGTGISSQDFVFRGVEIINPHPSHDRNTGAGLYINGSDIVIDGAAGSYRLISLRTGGVRRAEFFLSNDAEPGGGSHGGSTVQLNVFGDGGGYLSTPLSIARATGRTQLKGLITLEPLQLASYTVATLPSASTYPRGLIYVSDGTSNKRLALSDGTNWRFPDGAIVS